MATMVPPPVLVAAVLLLLVPHPLRQAAGDITARNQQIVEENWRHASQRQAEVMIGSRKLPELMGPILSHKFNVSRQQLRRGVVYKGAGYRLRNAVRKLMQGGQQVKIGVVGGSITFDNGHGPEATGWWPTFARYLTAAFPNAKLVVRNGAVGGTPAAYAVMCLEMMIDHDVDVVFIEYALNDGFENDILENRLGKIYERLIRKILWKPKKPAVVLMQVTSHGQAFDPPTKEFHFSPQDVYGALAQYYDLSWLSFRDSYWRLGNWHAEGYIARDFMGSDFLHPAGLGQKMMTDLAVMLIQDAALDLLLYSWDQQDQAMLEEQMPEPMYKGNYESANRMCLHNQDFNAVVAAHDGFEFVNEGTANKTKWGWVGTRPGASLTLKVNTLQDRQQMEQQVSVYLAYLKSYEHMGSADVRCVSGCSCAPKVMDALHGERNSQTFLLKLSVGQSESCEIKVTIAQATRSGEHKIKVSGIMIGLLSKASDRKGDEFNIREGSYSAERAHELTVQGQAAGHNLR